ncbi:MAG: hypothetical protein WBP59_14910 [Ilumatobacteraceae bacterium]
MTSVLAVGTPPSAAAAAASSVARPAATDPVDNGIPVDTANPFLPEDRDLSDCLGSVQRPGCGSSSRGGWHQNLVAIAMIGGLLIVFGRVAWVVVRSQRRNS